MKRIRYERPDKGNKNDNSYAITILNKISHKVKKHKYAANPKSKSENEAVQIQSQNIKIPNNMLKSYHQNQSSVPWVLWSSEYLSNSLGV